MIENCKLKIRNRLIPAIAAWVQGKFQISDFQFSIFNPSARWLVSIVGIFRKSRECAECARSNPIYLESPPENLSLRKYPEFGAK